MAFDDDDRFLTVEIAKGPICGVGDDATTVASHKVEAGCRDNGGGWEGLVLGLAIMGAGLRVDLFRVAYPAITGGHHWHRLHGSLAPHLARNQMVWIWGRRDRGERF